MSRSTVKILSADLLLVCLLASWAQAQQGSKRSSGREAYDAARARDRNMQNREMVMQHAGDEATEKQIAERLKALSAQAKEDFRRIQVLNNEMMRAATIGQSLDYRKIGDATGEINKCAKRLRTNLSALDTDEGNKQKRLDQLDTAEMRRALFSLDELVMNFVTSLAVVDTQNKGQSANYLRDIIELSGHIKRNAERIDKASQKQASLKP